MIVLQDNHRLARRSGAITNKVVTKQRLPFDQAPFDASNAPSLAQIGQKLKEVDRLDQTMVVWTKHQTMIVWTKPNDHRLARRSGAITNKVVTKQRLPLDQAPFDASNAPALTKIRHKLGAPNRLDQTMVVWTNQTKFVWTKQNLFGPNNLEQ